MPCDVWDMGPTWSWGGQGLSLSWRAEQAVSVLMCFVACSMLVRSSLLYSLSCAFLCTCCFGAEQAVADPVLSQGERPSPGRGPSGEGRVEVHPVRPRGGLRLRRESLRVALWLRSSACARLPYRGYAY